MVVLGPSGCGKTTLLKIIAGLLQPDSGEVRYDGVDVEDVPPGARRIGMVFQNYALYPHFTSRTNVLSYFLFRKKTPELDALARAKYQRTSELMGVELAYLLDRKPTTLSGGEKQRVALGRCITRDAALFLVDEPFANLDQALREKYRVNLKILLRQFNITTVYVTHDHHEALILADLLAVMDRGRIEQVGTPQEIYDAAQEHLRGRLPEREHRHAADQPHRRAQDARAPGHGGHRGPACVPRTWRSATGAPAQPAGDHRQRVPPSPARHAPARHPRGEHEVHAQIRAADARAGDDVWLRFKQYHLFDKASGARLRSYQRPLQG